MNYVLFETGNVDFFQRIMSVFISKVVQYILDAYDSVKWDNSGTPDFNANGQDLYFLNCALLLNSPCGYPDCWTEHTAALSSDQYAMYDNLMIRAKIAALTDKSYSSLKRAGLQTMFQLYESANRQRWVIINTNNIDCRHDHDKYLSVYIKQLQKLKKNARGFVYIRAAAPSDYDYIKNRANLPNLTACDTLNDPTS